jgi:uncharacterized protein
MPPLDHYATIMQALARWQTGTGPSDLQGAVSGYLCAGGRADASDWLDRMEITPGLDGATSDPALRDLFEQARAQFAREPAQVEPLLPAATAPLQDRAQALVEWCRGFLGGFGLGGGAAGAYLSGEGAEILGDHGTIAAMPLQGNDEDEAALAEVLAFVRTAVALLQRHAQAARRKMARSVH